MSGAPAPVLGGMGTASGSLIPTSWADLSLPKTSPRLGCKSVEHNEGTRLGEAGLGSGEETMQRLRVAIDVGQETQESV